jgi:isopenicillin-N N-acyltransferase like protein
MSVTIVPVAGSAAEMGHRQGEVLAPQIKDTVSFYEEAISAQGDPAAVSSALPPYIDAARATWPDLAAEIDGLARGAGIELEEAWMLNCLEEVWPFEACTTLSTGDFLLHSEQWYAGHDGVAVVVAEPDDGPAFVSPTNVGFLPAVGINAAGFAQSIDSLTAADDRVGIPRVLVSRRALAAPSLEGAIAAATVAGRAGGYAHTLKSAERTVVVETTATESVVLPGLMMHTNHYLSEKLKPIGETPSKGSLRRLAGARELVGRGSSRTLDDCVRMMCDHTAENWTFCLHGSGTQTATVFGAIFDVTTGTMLVSDGPPCEGRWHELPVPGYKQRGAARVG